MTIIATPSAVADRSASFIQNIRLVTPAQLDLMLFALHLFLAACWVIESKSRLLPKHLGLPARIIHGPIVSAKRKRGPLADLASLTLRVYDRTPRAAVPQGHE
jgi:hypothetical protein